MSKSTFVNESDPVELKVTDTYGEKWTGSFSFKIKLSGGDLLRISQLRRQYIGPNPAAATNEELGMAQIYANLDVRVVKAPKWWSETGGQTVPFDVAGELYGHAMKVEDDYIMAHNEAAKAARDKLRADKAAEEEAERKAAGEEG